LADIDGDWSARRRFSKSKHPADSSSVDFRPRSAGHLLTFRLTVLTILYPR
jgi:hypothetical protein